MKNTDISWGASNGCIVFNQGWQYPNITEKWAFDKIKNNISFNSSFSQLVFFPWATLIDFQRKGKLQESDYYTTALKNAPPKNTLIRATVCQHIFALDIINWLKTLGVTDLYWSHAVLDVNQIDGIRIHPFPLYPVACENLFNGNIGIFEHKDRPYLYGFVGAFDPDLYISPVRNWIFNLPYRKDALVIRRNEWHFEKKVYEEQIAGNSLSLDVISAFESNSSEYMNALKNSIFSLCPSGSGPNSIRLWESLGFGCIPVLMSDKLRLPGDQALWDKAIVKIPEDAGAVADLPKKLDQIFQNKERLSDMLISCSKLWQLYGLENGPKTIFGAFSYSSYIYNLINGKNN